MNEESEIQLDYYQLLGLSPRASQSEIRKAYKELCQKLHPDKSTGSEEAFRRMKRAYDVLSKPDRRRIYDLGQRQGIDYAEFSQLLKAATSSLSSSIMQDLMADPRLSFVDALERHISIAEEEIQSSLEKLNTILERLDRELRKLKTGQESHIVQALQSRRKELTVAATENKNRSLVLEFLREDSSQITCKEPKDERESFRQFTRPGQIFFVENADDIPNFFRNSNA